MIRKFRTGHLSVELLWIIPPPTAVLPVVYVVDRQVIEALIQAFFVDVAHIAAMRTPAFLRPDAP